MPMKERTVHFPTIRDNRDLRMAYSLLGGGLVEGFSPELTQAIKRAIRAYNHLEYDAAHRVVKDDGDAATLLVEFPENITDREAAEGYFHAYEERECVPGPYDCTGQVFTAWYKIFQRRGRWYAYHHLCMDV